MKQYTEEQKKEYKEKKIAKQKSFAEYLKSLSEEQKQNILKTCGYVTIEGRVLSNHNNWFLFWQGIINKMDITVIGGYQQWQRAGRKVKKGEKALFILHPISNVKKEDEFDENERVYFKEVSMFDISQTEMEKN